MVGTFGSKSAGQAFLDPSMPVRLRYTPSGDRALASSPFWRNKYELGPAHSFGIGGRPDPSKINNAYNTAGPAEYGDVSRSLSKIRRSTVRSGISMKPRYPSMEEKYRDLSWPKSGPGPGKYDTRIEAGKSSWTSPSANPSWSLPPRGFDKNEKKEDYFKPGPTTYEVRGKPGENYPIKRGTLYSVSFKGRATTKDITGDRSPGPGRYDLKGKGGTMPMRGRPLDEYGLWEKIANVKVPPPAPTAQSGDSSPTTDSDSTDNVEDVTPPKRLLRVESSPA